MKFKLPSYNLFSLSLFFFNLNVTAQIDEDVSKKIQDSIVISEVQDKLGKDKVLHAEPLFIDLIRDLGARKGEKEWNVGFGLSDNAKYDEYTALVEYEWAPVDRLGLEVELPFSMFYGTNGNAMSPRSKLNSIKLAGQYSFFVSEKLKSTLAIGYIHEFEMTDFQLYGKSKLFEGNVFNPFFIAAKRWGNNFHTLVYTGPTITHHFLENEIKKTWQINSNVHYMIPGTRNFIGLEVNQNISHDDTGLILRPQMRVSLSDHLLVGIVTGIPIKKETERFSSFIRLIYEPKDTRNGH
jgi:hypothetical protein